MTRRKGDVFVPNGDSRRETAILLVGTAAEHGISREDIHATPSGFFITDPLADILYEAGQDDDLETSGNRAAKNDSPDTEEEE